MWFRDSKRTEILLAALFESCIGSDGAWIHGSRCSFVPLPHADMRHSCSSKCESLSPEGLQSPARGGRECLREIEASPEEYLIRNVLTKRQIQINVWSSLITSAQLFFSQAPLDPIPSSAEPVDPSMKRGSRVQSPSDCDAGASAMTAG